jgi:hypothetical protein
LTDHPLDPATQEQTDVDPEEAERQLAEARGRRKRALLDLDRETLPSDTRHYAIANLLDQEVEAVLDGRGVTSQGGNPRVIGEFLLAVESFIERLGGALVMRRLTFGNSVHVILQPDVPKPVRDRVQQLAEQDPEGVATREELRQLIPDQVVAAAAAARILSVPAPEALPYARRYGAEVPDAYVRLARTVESTGGRLVLRAPGGREATLTADRAETVIRSLKQPVAPLDPVTIEVVGNLTRTDSEERMFRLVLDRERIPDVLDKRKRHLEGTYTPHASRQVRKEGLWDRRVIAKVDAYPTRDPLTGNRRFERFIFRSVRLAA